MAITKSIGTCCDEVIAELGFNSVDAKIDRRNVMVRMDAVRSELMGVLANGGVIGAGQTQIRATKGQPYEFNDIYYISRATPVSYDANRLRYYSEMPTDWVSMPNNNGIRIIRPKQTNVGSNYFIAQMAGASVAYGSLESANLGGMIGYEIEGNKLFYNNMPANQYSEILITYIPTLMALRETDILPADATFASILLDMTKNSFLVQLQKTEDKSVDSNSN